MNLKYNGLTPSDFWTGPAEPRQSVGDVSFFWSSRKKKTQNSGKSPTLELAAGFLAETEPDEFVFRVDGQGAVRSMVRFTELVPGAAVPRG